MKDYFSQLKDYLNNKYVITNHKETLYDNKVDTMKGFEIDDDVKFIYEHYKEFMICWVDHEEKYIGEVHFIPYHYLETEHDELIELMKECYDTEEDEYDIVQDIINYYPLFYFPNGDAFCLDIRKGTVVFYEHEVYDTGKNLHGLLIAKSVNDLFEKWNLIHFADVYYWDEIADEEGIDIHSELARQYI